MTKIFCDSNVALKWFHVEGEEQMAESTAIVRLGRRRDTEVRILDLTYFEIGNALVRKKRLATELVVSAFRRLPRLTGVPVRLSLDELSMAAGLAEVHGLTFYDAAYWAASVSHQAELVTMDAALLKAGAGSTPAQLCDRLGIEPEAVA